MEYLSEFTKWLPGEYIVKSSVDKQLYPMPINQDTLEMFFKRKFKSKNDIINFLEKKRVKIKNPKNFEEFVLSKLGKEIYEKFYKNYTIKQWDINPKYLSKELAGRLPIRFNRDPYYVKEKLRFMPKKGFTAMFSKMIKDYRLVNVGSVGQNRINIDEINYVIWNTKKDTVELIKKRGITDEKELMNILINQSLTFLKENPYEVIKGVFKKVYVITLSPFRDTRPRLEDSNPIRYSNFPNKIIFNLSLVFLFINKYLLFKKKLLL
mgnify:CR=1 FL=1